LVASLVCQQQLFHCTLILRLAGDLRAFPEQPLCGTLVLSIWSIHVLVRAQQGLSKGADEVFQQTLIIGNLGKDPEMRYTPDGTPVTSFTVAVNKRWTGRDGSEQDKTTWYRVTCWRKLAETTNQYLKKGKQVMVIGEVEATAFLGQDGQPRATLELTAREVKFLGGRDDAGSMGASTGPSSTNYAQEEEDIPF